MKKIATIAGVLTLVFSANAFAQSGSIDIPGIGSVKGASGSEVKNSTINVMGNKSGKVTVGGGSQGAGPVSANMSGQANVNSVQISNSKVSDSRINVMDNSSEEVNAIGGQANVNSVQIH